MPNLISFLECSPKEQLDQECAMLAERWNWTHEQIRELTTNQRHSYLEIVNDLYRKEKEAYEKAKQQSKIGHKSFR